MWVHQVAVGPGTLPLEGMRGPRACSQTRGGCRVPRCCFPGPSGCGRPREHRALLWPSRLPAPRQEVALRAVCPLRCSMQAGASQDRLVFPKLIC